MKKQEISIHSMPNSQVRETNQTLSNLLATYTAIISYFLDEVVDQHRALKIAHAGIAFSVMLLALPSGSILFILASVAWFALTAKKAGMFNQDKKGDQA